MEETLHATPPLPAVVDPATGVRLAKRHDSLALRTLRAEGASPQAVLDSCILAAPKTQALSHTELQK